MFNCCLLIYELFFRYLHAFFTEFIDFKTLGVAKASDKDDLKKLKGIGPFIEEKLNALGIYTFLQISKMTPEIEEQVNVAIEFFRGRVRRDKWAQQAKDLHEKKE